MRYAAFLRGVTPMNAKMPALRAAVEAVGYTEVVTVLGSGNVVFSARSGKPAALESKLEAAFEKHVKRAFMTIVRPIDALADLLERDPFAKFELPAKAKRVVTFVRTPPARKLSLPIEYRGATILALTDGAVLTAYVPRKNDPAFMTLIENTFGKECTTRTWDTVQKVIAK